MNYVNIYGMDTTALKKAEQAKEGIIENTPVPMVIVNNSGKIISFNRKFTAKYGYTSDDIVSRTARWKNIYPDPGYREKINREWQSAAARSLETGKVVEGILSEIACRDGSRAIVESSIISMDEVSLIVMADVTEQHRTSRLLKASESKYKELVEGTNDLITSVDDSGNFLFVNKMSEKFIGSDPESSIGISAFQFIHPDDRKKTAAWFKACIKNHIPGSMIENRQVNSRTGEIFHMLWTCNFHYDEQGSLKNVNSVARDITQRKRYEDGLKKIALEKPYESGRQFFNTVVTQLAQILGADYTLIGEVVSHPKKIKTLSLYADGQIEGNLEYELAHTPCENVVGKSICTYKHGVARLFPKDVLLEQMGVEGYVGAPLFDSQKNAIGLLAALYRKPVEDISFAASFLQLVASRTAAEMERSRVEKALRESEKRFRDISMGMADWIWEIDEALNFTYVSQSVKKVLGYRPEEMLGKSPFEFMAEADGSNARTLMTRIAGKKKRLKDVEHWYTGKQGNRVCLLENGIPVFDDAYNLKGYRGVNKNITPQKILEAEKAEAERHLQQALKMEAVGTISGGIAHDFNNILGIIIGNTELAMDDIPEWNRARMNLNEIRTASLRARDVVKQLLSFSRKTEQTKKPLTLQPIIEESVKLLRASIPASIEIEVDISRETGTIEADQTQIHQVLINLCTNAAHAMDKNGGTLTIQLSEVELDGLAVGQLQEIRAGRYARLTISDTGHGITPDLKAKIFDPYFTTKEIGKGTGMGLAVVIGIVKSHNGDISVHSEPGKGSTINVLLPLIGKKERPGATDTPAIPKGEGRIFFIDDEPAMVKMGAGILERIGYRVDTETAPLRALEKIRSNPFGFDLVITDMTMPELTGDHLAREILRINPQLPIIICSGFSSKMDQERAREIGIERYIDKPLNKNEMARAVYEVLSKRKINTEF